MAQAWGVNPKRLFASVCGVTDLPLIGKRRRLWELSGNSGLLPIEPVTGG